MRGQQQFWGRFYFIKEEKVVVKEKITTPPDVFNISKINHKGYLYNIRPGYYKLNRNKLLFNECMRIVELIGDWNLKKVNATSVSNCLKVFLRLIVHEKYYYNWVKQRDFKDFISFYTTVCPDKAYDLKRWWHISRYEERYGIYSQAKKYKSVNYEQKYDKMGVKKKRYVLYNGAQSKWTHMHRYFEVHTYKPYPICYTYCSIKSSITSKLDRVYTTQNYDIMYYKFIKLIAVHFELLISADALCKMLKSYIFKKEWADTFMWLKYNSWINRDITTTLPTHNFIYPFDPSHNPFYYLTPTPRSKKAGVRCCMKPVLYWCPFTLGRLVTVIRHFPQAVLFNKYTHTKYKLLSMGFRLDKYFPYDILEKHNKPIDSIYNGKSTKQNICTKNLCINPCNIGIGKLFERFTIMSIKNKTFFDLRYFCIRNYDGFSEFYFNTDWNKIGLIPHYVIPEAREKPKPGESFRDTYDVRYRPYYPEDENEHHYWNTIMLEKIKSLENDYPGSWDKFYRKGPYLSKKRLISQESIIRWGLKGYEKYYRQIKDYMDYDEYN